MSYEKGDRDRADPCKIYVGGNPEMEEDELRALLVAANARAAELETELLAARRQATRLQAECTTLERRCEGLTAERDAFASAMRTRWRRLAKSLRRSGLR